MCHFIVILAMAFFQEIPLKPKDEFEVKLDYAFRQRPAVDRNTVQLGAPVKSSSTAVLPYLILNIHLLKLDEAKMRMQVSTNLNARELSKRVQELDVVALDLGFTDDMIDRVTAHQYTVTFLNADKNPVDRIVINVDEDGSFFVNGEMRGKF